MANKFGTLITVARAIAAERHKEPFRCCHIAFIINKSKILAIGVNKPITHPLNKYYRYSDLKTGTCAELNAVVKLWYDDFSKCTLVVMRIDRENNVNSSCPCSGCKDMLKKKRFKRVWFSNNDGSFEKLKLDG